LSWHGALEPFSHQRAQLATGEGPSSPCLKAGAFWPQKGNKESSEQRPAERDDAVGIHFDRLRVVFHLRNSAAYCYRHCIAVYTKQDAF
jgi:hypothetical protein